MVRDVKTGVYKVDKKASMEFGLVAILVTSLSTLYLKELKLIAIVSLLTLIALLAPIIFYPFSLLWVALSRCLSFVVTRLIMILVFFLVVMPMGILRKFLGYDNLKLKQFKQGKESVMITKDHLYTSSDLENTF